MKFLPLATVLAILVIVCCLTVPSEACPNIVNRADWKAKPAKGGVLLFEKDPELPMVFIHHTARKRCFRRFRCSRRVRNIQRRNMKREGLKDIKYNFLVGEDGRVYKGRGWEKVGEHVSGCNNKSIGIAVIGTFNKRLPNPRALWVLKAFIQCGVWLRKLAPNYTLHGHLDAAANEDCPGKKLYDEISNKERWPDFRGKVNMPGCTL